MPFREFYDRHVRFVWRSLLRIGVAEAELPDAVQDVFVIVHRKLAEFEGRSKETTWLFGICLRVASDRRSLAYRRHEVPSPEAPLACDVEADPVALADRRRAAEMLSAILDRMSDEQRIVFSLFEFEAMTGEEIAELLELPIGTVRSRLRLAREEFQRCVSRLKARERAHTSGVLRAREV